MIVRRFKPEHLHMMHLQREQDGVRQLLEKPEYGNGLALAGDAFSVFDGDEVVACIGVAEISPMRAEAWALLSIDCGPHLRWITRAVYGWLQQTSYPRIDAVVSAAFAPGHRWAKLLGFEQEGPPRRLFMPDGNDGISYVRFKDGSPSVNRINSVSGHRGNSEHQLCRIG